MNRGIIVAAAFLSLSLGIRAGGGSPCIEEGQLLRGFDELNGYTLVSLSEKLVSDGSGERRYILDAEPLGRLLLVHELEESEVRRRFLYSAKRVVINVEKRVDLAAVERSLIEHGILCERPFEYSRFLYANIDAVTAEELYRLAERARTVAGEGCVVEFDPIAVKNGVGLVPNDPRYAKQWHHEELQSSEAWKITTGDPSIVVAVVDGGIFPDLKEFEGRLIEGANIRYLRGVEDNPEPHDDVGHGTAVTGLLAANANNSKLGVGIDWQCSIMPIRVTLKNAAATSPFVAGIDYAVAHGARVINVSWTTGPSNSLRTAVKNAADNGAIVVAGLGNLGVDGTWLPAKATEAIAVGATTRSGTRAVWSNWGQGIDLVAPSEDLYTVGDKDVDLVVGGTSGSTPLVAGAASLLLSLNPDLDWKGIRDLLAAGAIDQTGDPLDTPGWDEYYGWGRLNILNSLLLAKVHLNIEYVVNGKARLRWRVPSNLDERVGYYVEYSSDTLEWERFPNLEIAFKEFETGMMAEVLVELDSLEAASKFYRVAVDLQIEE